MPWFFDHAETITPKNIERVRALGGGIAIQDRMAFQGEYFVDRYGKKAAEQTPPIKRMLAEGVLALLFKMNTSSVSTSPWSPLQHKTFRWLWLASIASNIGTWMHEVGAGWLMTSLSANPLHVALVQVAGSAPMFFLALPAGALADIVDKRRYLLIVQIWMAIVAGLLAVMSLSGHMTSSLLILLSLGMGVGTAMMMPAWSALTPELVGKKDLSSAIALSSVGINVARAIGPAIAGVVVSLTGPWATFGLNALSFLGVIIVLFTWKREVLTPVLPAERLMGAMRAGLRYARASKSLQAVLIRAIAFFVGARLT